MIKPHGGRLVDRTVDKATFVERWDDISDRPGIHLSEELFQDVLNVATGRFSPLEGFMNRDDFLKVVHDMTLEDGTVWPLPIILDVDAEKATELEPGERVPLFDPDGRWMGALDVDEVFKFNKRETAAEVFGTTDDSHPGVANYYDLGDFLVGGPVQVFTDYRYNAHDLFPKESRVLFKTYGWDTVVGFQTRNAPHRGHEYIQKTALEQVDGILIQPKLGDKKPGDYRDDVILQTYERLIDGYYPPNQVALSVFPSRMRYAGPREAVYDALVRKNQGCTHFIIGRDHAGVGDFYEGDAAHTIFDEISDVGIQPMLFEHAFYCERCDGMCSEKVCPHGDDERVYPSGSTIREMVRQNQRPSPKMIRSEIANFIINDSRPFVEN